MRLLVLLALLLSPSRAFFFNHPSINGDSYSYKGDGNVPDHPESLFQLDDTFTDVSLIKCKLSVIPDEVRMLENLQELYDGTVLSIFMLKTDESVLNGDGLGRNVAENQLEAFDGVFTTSSSLIELNVSHNALQTFNIPLPHLTTLDLSSNVLTEFPNAVFASSQLDSFRISGNGFEIVTLSTAQYDFFAGLSDFQAAFADVSTCASGSLVYLQGKGVCRLDIAAEEDPAIVMRDHGADKEEPSTPMATVGVVIPHLPIPSNNITKKYIIAAIIVLMVIGMIAGVIALISLGIVGGIARAVYEYISRWQKKRHREGIHENTPLFFDQAARASYQKEMDAVDKLFPSNDPVLVTWRIDYDSVTLVKKIAQGAFGEVWVGHYRNDRVAVKRLIQDQVSLATSEAFLREIKLMAWLEHPKIVQFVGVAWTKLVDMLAVIEYMDGGDLRTLLDKKSPKKLPWQEGGLKLQYARDTIDAVVYLHSLSVVIIHRDLKSRNILLDSKKGVKLGDFGVSATKRQHDMTAGVGTARWLAPEIARGEDKYTEAVDVYSFGIILSELDTHQLPFGDAKTSAGAPLNDMAILQGVSSGTLQVTLSPTCPSNLEALARSCMNLDPAQRPTAAQVAYELRKSDLLL
ncbi:hypothetical protein AM587_10005232 [Phytophthora nicotianae]|uniref:Protein kinase domain-containing protein n=1 Tax=Phytophthora nicotianae TaxID=4792 RepID=A0A0W8D3U9_PHYNI|nr:hypothetical protein AM587_10006038 [Phytophthora nicotianae]KUF82322.1 hypothetical protein AM587_10005232 [Phytophthora nicotianae]KUF91060.1 hypothetical protein AM588_10003773 [Phytophthora nicotianae]